ncbi:MAG: glutamine amidotransferase [Oscillospiraceae bacterium]|nr:glutamine amidotransferase [Oscillospiraceae bacterium]
MTKLQICHLYPDLLNLYGDRGNIICMTQRLAWRGLEAEVTEVPVGATADFTTFDLIFIGGGQDFEQEVLLPDLRAGKDRELKAAIADGKTVLAICGGYQMLGNYYKTWDGQQCDFIGAIDLYTVGSKERMIGNFAFACGEESGGSTVVGFENHSGKTYLGDGVKPLGRILAGGGNNGSDGTEGVRHLNVFGTYSHGPILPKNPELCDHILETAFRRKDDSFRLPELDDTVERAAHDAVLKRVLAANA